MSHRVRACRGELREKRGSRSLREGRNVILPGQYFDAESGTNYNLFRNYEPAVGRYQNEPGGQVHFPPG